MAKKKNNEPPTQSTSSKRTTKAGKNHSFTAPQPPNPQRQQARLNGERQFIARAFPRPLPHPEGSWDQAMKVLCDRFDIPFKRQPNDDSGIRYDPTRKRFVSPPRKEN